MSWNLVRKTISDRWRGTVFYAAGIAAYVLMMAAIFPSIEKIERIQEIVDKYPENLFRFFGVEKIDMGNWNNYLTVEFLGLIVVIIIGAFVFSFARSITAGELKDGTLELLLAQPVERWKVLVSKGLVLVAGIVALVLTIVLSVYAFGSAFKVGVSYTGFLAYLPLASALFISIAGYSVLLTVILPNRGVMAAVGLTLAFYLVNFAASGSRSLDKLKYFTIFHYYDPVRTLESGTLAVRDTLVLLAAGLICLAAAVRVFQRKDIIL